MVRDDHSLVMWNDPWNLKKRNSGKQFWWKRSDGRRAHAVVQAVKLCCWRLQSGSEEEELLWLVGGRTKLWDRAWHSPRRTLQCICPPSSAERWHRFGGKKHLQHPWYCSILLCHCFQRSPISLSLLPHHPNSYLDSHLPFLTSTCTPIVACPASLMGMQIPSAQGATREQGGHPLTERLLRFAD